MKAAGDLRGGNLSSACRSAMSAAQDELNSHDFWGSTQNEVRGVKKYFDRERHHVQSHPEASR